MKILKTDCTDEQTKEDMPELLKLHAEAMETEIMWEFFGGDITLSNGHKYQVMSEWGVDFWWKISVAIFAEMSRKFPDF